MSMLLHLFQTTVALGNQPLMATISGYPGTGKSSLVNQIKKPLKDLNGCFIEGKFHKHAHPDWVLGSAVNAFFGHVLEANAANAFIAMKWRIHDAIGSGNNCVLLDLLPNLQKWLGDGHVAAEQRAPSSGVKGMGSSHRLKFMFCKLIAAIASKCHPLILFLDDLQWADDMTLDIVRMTMVDPDIRHFLFLGCYRDNEVDLAHPLTVKLKAIQDQGVNIVPIKIGPIERKCVNDLLSEALCMPPSLCWPLASVVHSKTGGIIMFVLKFLASLNDDGDLWFSMSSRRWTYNLEQIRLKEIHGDVVSFLTEHMKSLPKNTRMGLKFTACLGPNFDSRVLGKVKMDNEFEEDSFFESCVDMGFLQKARLNQYVWSHDQVQQAAYDLIPLQKREPFHLLVGSRLFMATPSSEVQEMIYFIVDNLNRGSKLLTDQDQKYEVSQLNLEAGEKALSASAFHSAAKYLLAGLSLLGEESWDTKHYHLTIKLYDAASEALFVIGNFKLLSKIINKPLTNARSFEDKLNILNNLVRSLAASHSFAEGISKCLSILCQLGEAIPNDVTEHTYTNEVGEVKLLLHGKSQQGLLSLPKMSKMNKLAAMQFMNHALSMTFIANPLLNHFIVLRMVKMSIEHGICSISAVAFASYGGLLVCEPTCDFEGGHGMGRVATEMVKQLGAIEMVPRLYSTVYGFINIWKEPWQAGQTKHLEAYELAASTGDMEYALLNLFQYSITAIYGLGENLESLSQNIQLYAKRAFQCNQRPSWIYLVILHQLTLELMDVDKISRSLLPTGLTEDAWFMQCQIKNEMAICSLICFKKKYGAFFTGDLDLAAEMCELSLREYPIGSHGRLPSGLVSVFIDGLIGFFFARKHLEDESKWINLGLDAIRTFREWVKSSDWNFSNKLHLLEAEFYFLKEDNERALAFYHASIKAAREHRLVHEEGLAEEKAGMYCLHKSRHSDAMTHFINAKKCYEVWGAHAVAHRVNKAVAVLLPLCTDTH